MIALTRGAGESLEELLQFLYLMPVGVVKFRPDGAVELMNPVASALLLSLTPDTKLDDIYGALAPIAPGLRQQVMEFAGEAGLVIDQHWLETSVGGSALVLSLTVNRISGEVYMAILRDVTRLAQQERKLFADQQKFRAIFDHVHDYAIYMITLDGLVEEWNQSMERYGGWQAADVDGHSLNMFFPLDDPDRPQTDMLLAEAQRIGSVETEGWRVKRNGSRLWANSIITAIPDKNGSARGFVVVSRDMTERKRLEDNMKRLATVDPLTGAFNRRQGDLLLAAEFNRHLRDGRPFAVLLLDIDHFKQVNDQFGHAAGDLVLCALVKSCRTALRTIDSVVRLGGEEFLLVLPDTDAVAAMLVAERVRATTAAAPIAAPDEAVIHVTVSIGVALAAVGDAEELLRRADAALYAAKRGGRDRVVLAA
jgi:diguanylate cyclase (GGDEF)-like protein/PAS domain S-box-containing protein